MLKFSICLTVLEEAWSQERLLALLQVVVGEDLHPH